MPIIHFPTTQLTPLVAFIAFLPTSARTLSRLLPASFRLATHHPPQRPESRPSPVRSSSSSFKRASARSASTATTSASDSTRTSDSRLRTARRTSGVSERSVTLQTSRVGVLAVGCRWRGEQRVAMRTQLLRRRKLDGQEFTFRKVCIRVCKAT